MALWRDEYLSRLRMLNYCETTIINAQKIINYFMLWAEERDLG